VSDPLSPPPREQPGVGSLCFFIAAAVPFRGMTRLRSRTPARACHASRSCFRGLAGTDVWSVSLLRLPHPTIRPTVSGLASSVMHPCQAARVPSPLRGKKNPHVSVGRPSPRPRLPGARGVLLRVAALHRFLTSRTLSLSAAPAPCQAPSPIPHPPERPAGSARVGVGRARTVSGHGHGVGGHRGRRQGAGVRGMRGHGHRRARTVSGGGASGERGEAGGAGRWMDAGGGGTGGALQRP